MFAILLPHSQFNHLPHGFVFRPIVLDHNALQIALSCGLSRQLKALRNSDEELRTGRLQAAKVVSPELKRYVTLAHPKHGQFTQASRIVAGLTDDDRHPLQLRRVVELGVRLTREDRDLVSEFGQLPGDVAGVDALASAVRIAAVDQPGDPEGLVGRGGHVANLPNTGRAPVPRLSLAGTSRV